MKNQPRLREQPSIGEKWVQIQLSRTVEKNMVWYFSQHLVEFGKEVRHLPAGFYLGYLRGRSFSPKMPNFPTPQKVLLSSQY